MKLGFARLYVKNGDVEYNYSNIEKFYRKALGKDLDMVIFPRLSLSGLNVGDNFLDINFLEKNIDYLAKIIDLTIGERTKITMGELYYEKEYQENNNIYKNLLMDSVFFIDNGYVDTISSRKVIDKLNILNDYRYFDKDTVLKQINYNKKKFAVLISDDIFSNFNVFLTSDNRPNYILCFDTSIRDIDFVKKHLIKLAKFANSPVFYINTSGAYKNIYFRGDVILINEDFEIVYHDIYKKDEILQFDIDCEDGSELFIPKLENTSKKNYDISHLLQKIGENVNIDDFTKDDIKNILKNKNLKCFTFNSNNSYDVNYIDVGKHIDGALYDKLNDEEKSNLKCHILNLDL
ncbi:MAG: hypothetical protein IJ853_03730 [Rickettsiales bacterium]|nr:hypothetical protein [Rickettsiales bacterium]